MSLFVSLTPTRTSGRLLIRNTIWLLPLNIHCINEIIHNKVPYVIQRKSTIEQLNQIMQKVNVMDLNMAEKNIMLLWNLQNPNTKLGVQKDKICIHHLPTFLLCIFIFAEGTNVLGKLTRSTRTGPIEGTKLTVIYFSIHCFINQATSSVNNRGWKWVCFEHFS